MEACNVEATLPHLTEGSEIMYGNRALKICNICGKVFVESKSNMAAA
jgi:hypothetical protein